MEIAGSKSRHRGFAIVFVLGAPGAGKGTLSTHLAREHSMLHYSVGDGLRGWMRSNRDTLLAAQIRDKLDNQGFLSSEDLNPILEEAIIAAFNHEEPRYKGIIIDGFPRCIEQLDSFDTWPFQDKLPLAPGSDGLVAMDSKPDVVLSFGVSKLNAKARYLGRGRDDNDSEEKFERRFEEYERETTLVEEEYRRRGILINVDGSKADNIAALATSLKSSGVWQNLVFGRGSRAEFVVQDP